MNLSNLTALELGKKIQSKEISVWEAVTASLDAIQQKEHELASLGISMKICRVKALTRLRLKWLF